MYNYSSYYDRALRSSIAPAQSTRPNVAAGDRERKIYHKPHTNTWYLNNGFHHIFYTLYSTIKYLSYLHKTGKKQDLLTFRKKRLAETGLTMSIFILFTSWFTILMVEWGTTAVFILFHKEQQQRTKQRVSAIKNYIISTLVSSSQCWLDLKQASPRIWYLFQYFWSVTRRELDIKNVLA